MALSKEDLLEVWRKSMDGAYTVPLEEEADGRGFDIIAAIAAVFARVADGMETTTQAMYLYEHSSQTAPESSGGVQASGTVTLTRTPPTDGEIELYEGDLICVFVRDPDGVDLFEVALELSADVTLIESVTPVNASVRAIRAGHHGNVPDTEGRSCAFLARTVLTVEDADTSGGNKIIDVGTGDSFDETILGAFVLFTDGPNEQTHQRRIIDIDTVGTAPNTTVIVDGPSLVSGSGNNDLQVVDINDIGVTVELNGDLSGGVHAWLDQLGSDRDIGRNPGESDTDYRERVRYLPDTIAPNAIERAISRILRPLGIPYEYIESRSVVGGGAWDHMPYDNPETYNSLTGRNQHIYQGNGFQYRGFYVVVERRYYGDFGFAWDDKYPSGQTPRSAWDFSFYDGYALGYYNDLFRLINEIEKTRASGVPWLLVLVDEGTL